MTGSIAPDTQRHGVQARRGHPVHLLEKALNSREARPGSPAAELKRHPGVITPDETAVFEPDLGQNQSERQDPVIHLADAGALDAFPDTSEKTDGEPGDMLDTAGQAQLRGMVDAFHQRQRQASLVVAASVAAAVVLTLCGLFLLWGANA